ncbi:hypothetical protein [Enterococcus cecorum]|uniref:hypothetical protein n=1 Tax=Enterococcus cecorum TaxID=44008 RepID=UPI000B38720E|nr:hypothetical protein [Enterococcus cecorum]MCJ0573355.1 hypothetical protein [Enterococcus cecorum]MCJ0575130.1 hypothetical protein [Enterococcus cecorum]MDZ5600900.1 hypothetical protein [Enterococcus cecorum]OUN50325.1 hypothetical protein B5G19_05010 [Enterococcus cecorum]CAI3331525.1 hypothetical protein CIRMBP1257_00836 [Enterococcus cecorum]
MDDGKECSKRVAVKSLEVEISEEPNIETREAIEEGRRIARNPNVQGYHSIDELKEALED